MRKLLLLGFLAAALAAQAQDVRPAFEAVSVKPNDSGSGSTSSHGTKGQLVMNNLSIQRLIERAYTVAPYQVAGPDWLDSVRFDIAAKYPPDTKDEDRPLMLRSLLEDRFKLALHRETRSLPGYALVVAKGGFKLKPVEPGGSGTNSDGGRIKTMTATKVSIHQLAEFVSRAMSETVVDKTELSGVYDFSLRWSNEDPDPNAVSLAPTLAMALQETLGVRLQAQKVPVGVIVVDHVERVPTEN